MHRPVNMDWVYKTLGKMRTPIPDLAFWTTFIVGYPGEVEGSDEQIAIGRTYRDAPEIDGMVFIEGQPPIGEIVPVKINGAMTYDLTGAIETSQNLISLSASE